jgi:hypothetical protein
MFLSAVSAAFLIFAAPKHKSHERLPLLATDVFQDGAVAQLVEQRTENPCVGGSIPPHTTVKQKASTDIR